MKQALDLENWARKEHFNFFRQFEEPFFGVTVQIDCTNAYHKAKELSVSFFLYYLHCSLAAANEIEPFRYQISGDIVWKYDAVHASPTINRPDGTFGFGYLEFHPSFKEFNSKALIEIKKVQESKSLFPPVISDNIIHYSSIPWIDFSAISHARSFSYKDSCPKISFGKMSTKNGIRTMPVSIHVHHALMDGYHVGLFVEKFQQFLG